MNAMKNVDVNPILVPIPVAAKTIGRGVTFIYQKIADGTIDAVKSDKRTLVVYESLRGYAASLAKAKIGPMKQRTPV
jgi:hypothetical protein